MNDLDSLIKEIANVQSNGINAAIIAAIVSIIIGFSTIMFQWRNAKRTSIVSSISKERIEWVNNMRDNFVEFNNLLFVLNQQRKFLYPEYIEQEINVLLKLGNNIELLINPTESYSKALIGQINSVIVLIQTDNSSVDKIYQMYKDIMKLQQIILKSEWSRTKLEIEKGKVINDEKVKAIYSEKAIELGLQSVDKNENIISLQEIIYEKTEEEMISYFFEEFSIGKKSKDYINLQKKIYDLKIEVLEYAISRFTFIDNTRDHSKYLPSIIPLLAVYLGMFFTMKNQQWGALLFICIAIVLIVYFIARDRKKRNKAIFVLEIFKQARDRKIKEKQL
ncbi:hypothetical protein [Bacillus safensis]|uniref:hypothetical protein n=1 Tax=Bacillus safensis TaxID=561879 RepID=UPI000BA5B6FC|nr:hypothetical protein [Bacillus safensis]OYN65453.1 hypothetical protein CFH85_12450 [Bacillus safensis]